MGFGMDCGSCTKEIVYLVEKHRKCFHIGANGVLFPLWQHLFPAGMEEGGNGRERAVLLNGGAYI